VTDHQIGVSTQVGPAGQDASFGFCSCDWRGPLRDTREAAAEDALMHLPEEQRDAVGWLV
jgi:hypothetical protein